MKKAVVTIALAAVMLVVGCAHTEKKAVLEDPPWQQASGPSATGQYFALDLADFNRDGFMDAAGGGAEMDAVSVWYGDGAGGWTHTEHIRVEGKVRSVAAGDLDGDGLDDIAFSVQGRGTLGVQVWMNSPEGVWSQGNSPIEEGNYEGVKMADVNNDGFLDIIAANATSEAFGGVQVWLGDGQGGWITETGPVNLNRYMDASLGDVDGDGDLDLAASGIGTHGALRVWLGDGKGGWSPTESLETGDFFKVTLDDFDWDGNLDVAAGTYYNGIRIYYGDGHGNFQKHFSPATKGSFWKVIRSSCEMDGTPSLLASSIDNQGIASWRLGDDGFWHPVDFQLPSSSSFYDMDQTDLDGDRRCDLCVASYGEGIKVWLGQGGTPGPAIPRPAQKKAVKAQSGPWEEVNENNTFSTSIAGFPEYRIGPDDILEITFWRGIDPTTHQVLVRPDGTISFGYVEDLNVNGMTPIQLDRALTKDFEAYTRNPRIDITVVKFNSKPVTLMGAIQELAHRVSGPGIYTMRGKSTLYEMISHAGGFEKDADLQRVTVRRQDGKQLVVDLYKFIMLGDRTQNVVLDQGDYVFVPRLSESQRRVFVVGQVRNPGVYSVGQDSSVIQAIAQAGGFKDAANLESTKIIRGDLSKPDILAADMKALLKENDQSQNLAIQSGDIVYVPRSFIGDLSAFSRQVIPFLELILYPGKFRDAYMYQDALRFNVGGTQVPTSITVNSLP